MAGITPPLAPGSGTYAGFARSAFVNLVAPAVSQTNWNSIAFNNLRWWAVVNTSSGAQNAVMMHDIGLLQAGTYSLSLYHNASTNRGIYTPALAPVADDGTVGAYVDQPTIDGYAGVAANTLSTVSVTVPTAGRYRLRLTMATKNGSSSDYYGDVSAAQLVRTA